MHELDELEKTLSTAHSIYYKPSEIEQLLRKHGFKHIKTKTIRYNKKYPALVEDKAKYFKGKLNSFSEVLEKASEIERKLYGIAKDQLTLFYTLVFGLKS